MEEEEDIKMLLVKYITRQTTDEEKEVVKNWVNAHPENEQYFAQLYEAWQLSLLTKPEGIVDAKKAYQLFLSKSNQQASTGKAVKISLAMALGVAAMLIVTLLPFKNKYPLKATVNQLAAVPGQISKITLTDGSVVWLNSSSVLKYGADFGKTTRTVYLEGEGFFEIAPGKKDIPFLVHTKNYIVRDIGTRFNLKAYPNDPYFETAVVNGEISIEDKGQKDNATNRMHIKQKQTLRIWNHSTNNEPGSTDNNMPVKRYKEIQITEFAPDKTDNYIGWKDNLLVFDNNTMDEIARVLERRYNVKISIADTTLRAIRYSGNFKNVKSIDRVLNIIKQNTPISYSATSTGIITIIKDKN